MSLSELRALTLRAAVPDIVWGTAVLGETAPLFDAEDACMRRAVPKRRAEFLSGRIAARRAMAQLGITAAAIPSGADRAPIWPQGIVGSISHCEGLAVAAVARSTAGLAIGLDLEQRLPIEPALIPEIVRPDEGAAMQADDAGLNARRIFSAKEAVYKALFPQTGVVFGFHALAVSLDTGTATLPSHHETATIAQVWQDRILPFSQWQGDTLVLSLCSFRS